MSIPPASSPPPAAAKDLRILHVISSLDAKAGGPPIALVGLAKAQMAAGMRITVVSTHGQRADMRLAEELRAAGAVVELIGPSRWPLAWHREIEPTLRRAIARNDIVHIHALWEEIQHRACRIAHRLDVPYVITTHGMLDPWSLSQGQG